MIARNLLVKKGINSNGGFLMLFRWSSIKLINITAEITMQYNKMNSGNRNSLDCDQISTVFRYIECGSKHHLKRKPSKHIDNMNLFKESKHTRTTNNYGMEYGNSIDEDMPFDYENISGHEVNPNTKMDTTDNVKINRDPESFKNLLKLFEMIKLNVEEIDNKLKMDLEGDTQVNNLNNRIQQHHNILEKINAQLNEIKQNLSGYHSIKNTEIKFVKLFDNIYKGFRYYRKHTGFLIVYLEPLLRFYVAIASAINLFLGSYDIEAAIVLDETLCCAIRNLRVVIRQLRKQQSTTFSPTAWQQKYNGLSMYANDSIQSKKRLPKRKSNQKDKSAKMNLTRNQMPTVPQPQGKTERISMKTIDKECDVLIIDQKNIKLRNNIGTDLSDRALAFLESKFITKNEFLDLINSIDLISFQAIQSIPKKYAEKSVKFAKNVQLVEIISNDSPRIDSKLTCINGYRNFNGNGNGNSLDKFRLRDELNSYGSKYLEPWKMVIPK